MAHRRAELRVDVMHEDVFLFLRHLLWLEFLLRLNWFIDSDFVAVVVSMFCHLHLCDVLRWERPRRVVWSKTDVSSQRFSVDRSDVDILASLGVGRTRLHP